MPSIVTRSNGGWSRSAVTSSARTRPAQRASGSRTIGALGIRARIRASASATSVIAIRAVRSEGTGGRSHDAILSRRRQHAMSRFLLGAVFAFLAVTGGAKPESRSVLGERNPVLAAGADAIRAGRYDDGIRLTLQGLESETVSQRLRSA